MIYSHLAEKYSNPDTPIDLNDTLFTGLGNLNYSVLNGYYRLSLDVDYELHRYLRSLVPPKYVCKPTRYFPHITVVRNEPPVILSNWEKYPNRTVRFHYSDYLHYDNTYWWINCWSEDLVAIRLELGLPPSHHHTRPSTDEECFHSTVGNSKT